MTGETDVGISRPIDGIADLFRIETHSVDDMRHRVDAETKATYSFDEVYGMYARTTEHIEAPLDVVFDYVSDIKNLEEWSFSIRGLKPIGGGLYRGREIISRSDFFIRAEIYPDCHLIDWPCAWDQGLDLYMLDQMRLLDGQRAIGRPGTVVLWTLARHRYFDRAQPDLPDYVRESQARQDRPWIGDIWPIIDPIHRIEVENLKRIVEHRFRTAG